MRRASARFTPYPVRKGHVMETTRGLRVTMLGVNYAPEPTGIAPYTTGVAEGLVARGHTVRVLTSYPHYPNWSRPRGVPRSLIERRNGVVLERLRHYVPKDPDALRRAAFEVSFGSRILGRARSGADVVIAVSPALLSTSMAVAGALASRQRPAVGLVVQDLYSSGVSQTGTAGDVATKTMTAIESWTARAVDGVAVIHDRFADQVVSELRVPRDRVDVIRNWSHAAKAPSFDRLAFRSRLGWRPDDTVVLHTGAMGLKQGLENVVEAARMADAAGSAIRFVLVGDGSQRRALELQATGVRRIQFVDPLDDADFAMALVAADILLVNERPGVRDMAVPSKLTSYFAAQRPVLAASERGSTTAMELQAASAGVRVAPGNPQLLLDAASALANDPSRDEMGRAGGRYARDVLSADAAVDAYEDWVRALAMRRQSMRGTT